MPQLLLTAYTHSLLFVLVQTEDPQKQVSMRSTYEEWSYCIFLFTGQEASKRHVSIASLDSDTLADLEQQLDDELQHITWRYGCYVSCIRETLEGKGLDVKKFCSDLKTLSAFNHTRQKRQLVSAHETDLNNAVDFVDVVDLLAREYASFLNPEVFEHIISEFKLDTGQENLQYRQHLDAYVRKHTISEFIKINPLLQDFSDTSKEFILKLDIETTSELGKIKRLKGAVAKILGINSAALRLLDIKEGCVVATFLIPTPVAEVVFNRDTVLTQQQKQELESLPVMWMECNGCKFVFGDDKTDQAASLVDLGLKAESADDEVKPKPSNNLAEKGIAGSEVHKSKVEFDYDQEERLRAKVAHYNYQDPSAGLSLTPGKCVDFGDQVARYSGYVCKLHVSVVFISLCVQW